MEKLSFDLLQTKALTLLSEREKTTGLRLVHVATDTLPSIKARVFKFFAAKKDAPNQPPYEIVLDEAGDTVDPEELGKREGIELFTWRDWSVDPALLWRFGAADAQFIIEPAVNNLTLNAGDSHPEEITVSIPKQTPDTRFDIYLLADTTESMASAIAEVKGHSDAIVTRLQGMGLDVAFGVGNYKDFWGGQTAFQHQLSPTTNAAAVQAAIAAWNAASPVEDDWPEAQLFALDQIAENVNGQIEWRLGVKRVLVWFGDNPGHEPICQALTGLPYDIDTGRVAGKLASQGIVVIAISLTTLGPADRDARGEPLVGLSSAGLDANPDQFLNPNNLGPYTGCEPAGTPNQAKRIASATGGIHLIGISPPLIDSAILSAVATTLVEIDDLHLELRGEAAQFVDLGDPSFYEVDSLSADGLRVKFVVEFEGVRPCAREAQVFEGAIDVVVNGDIKVSKALRVTVPPCKPVRIQGSPSAAVERNAIREPNSGFGRANRISVFARGRENQLRRCSHNANPQDEKSWRWEDKGSPGSLVVDSPFAIVLAHEHSQGITDHIHAFVTARNGHLHEISWDGRQWSNWVDHGQPFWQASVAGSPAAVAFRLPASGEAGERIGVTQDRLATLIWGSDGGLYHRDWDGNWGWNGSLPNGTSLASAAEIIHRPFRFIYCYVVGTDGHLYVSRSTDDRASSWLWVDLGQPAPETGLDWLQRPSTVPFLFENQNRLYTFVAGQDGNLWVHVWRGHEPGSLQQMALDLLDVGTWSNQGTPAGVRISSAASVVTHPHGGNNQIYTFVRGSDNLYVNYWDAANFTWVWRDLGQPANATVHGDPAAVICEHPARDPIYVFVRGSDDYLHMCHVDSGITRPQWLNLDVEHW